MLVNFAGSQIGEYTLLAEIGRGGMGRVYRASHPATSQHFAIKIVSSLTTRDEKFEQRFWREIAVVNRLNHPAILPVLASGQEDDGTLYMVMPLIENGTLKDHLLRRLALTPAEAYRVIAQIGEALDYAHGQGVIHRDVKPHNIMMLGEDQVCLTDFGVASLASVDETISNLTTTGATLGTFAYMSPEQISGGDLDGRSDVYALGVVLYQGLLGRLPFNGDNTATLLSQQLHSLPLAPHLVNPDFPPAVEAVLDRALAKKPDDRYKTGAEFAGALNRAFIELPEDGMDLPLVTEEQIAVASTIANMPATGIGQAQPQEKRLSRRLLLAGLALLLLAIAACAVVVLPLQAQLAEVQGTAAALGSRTPMIVTQVVTNAAGESVVIQITATPAAATPSIMPTLTTTPTVAVRPTVLPTSLPQPTAAPSTDSGSTSGGQGGSGAAATSPADGSTGGATGGTSAANGGGSSNSGGNSGSSNSGGNSGGSNSGGNSGGSNSGGNGKGNKP